MNSATHVRYEIIRTFRNRLLLGLTMALPLILYYSIASANAHSISSGVSFRLYFMTGMAAYGAMFAAVSPGPHIADDRLRGWTRQMRITPLRTRAYFAAKVLAAYLLALPALALVFAAGASLGVHLDAAQWLETAGLLLVGLAPFILMSLVLGHLLTGDAAGPAVAGVVVIFALFGGAYGGFFDQGTMLSVVKLIPSFWLVQAGKAALVLGDWPAEGWIVIAAWTAVLIPIAVAVYRRDTSRA